MSVQANPGKECVRMEGGGSERTRRPIELKQLQARDREKRGEPPEHCAAAKPAAPTAAVSTVEPLRGR